MDQEWQRPGVRFPNHLVKWATPDKYPNVGYQSEATGLWYRQGKKMIAGPSPKIKSMIAKGRKRR